MKKRFLSVIAAMALCVSAAVSPVSAREGDAAALEQEILAASENLAKNLEETVAASDYQPSYNEYLDAMLCMKNQKVSEELLTKMDNALQEKVAAYDDTFLNPYASTDVKSYALAAAILYLEERGTDVTNYNGKNLIAMLKDTFMQEETPNPYVYSYIKAILQNEKVQDTAVQQRVKDGVLSYYVDDAVSGSGIDYWGVSADNNGQVLTALADEYKTDADIKSKVDAALAWNKTQTDATGAVVSWGTPSSNSTALALRCASQFGAMEEAASYYNALMQFKSTTTKGAYTYAGEDSIYSTRDALTGMMAYRAALNGTSLFAVVYQAGGQKPLETEQPDGEKKDESSQKDQNTPVPQSSASDTPGQASVTTGVGNAPKTGDTSYPTAMVVVMVMAVAAAAVVKGGRDGKQTQH